VLSRLVNMETRQIYIVEDNPLMRGMLQEYIESLTIHEVVGSARTAEIALKELPGLAVSLLLLDVALPGMSGIDLVAEVATTRPEIACLMISAHHNLAYVRKALEAGARGYVLKGSPDELADAIETVLTGGTYVSGPLRMPHARRRSET
jgi:DNA-binding NarL/FixJ family response regulator